MRRSRRLLCGAGALALVGSLAANVALMRALETSFARVHHARLFPLGYVGDDLPAAPRGPSLAFWGDSRAAAWAASDVAQGIAVLDFAHGGQTSSQVLMQLRTTPAVHTTYALLQVGINDLHPLGALPVERTRALARLRANLAAIRDALRARSDAVVLTTIAPPAPVPLLRRRAWDPRTLADLAEVNEAIRQAADGRDVLLLDVHALLRGDDALLPERYRDPDFFLHLNPAAYARLNEALRRLLAQHRPGS